MRWEGNVFPVHPGFHFPFFFLLTQICWKQRKSGVPYLTQIKKFSYSSNPSRSHWTLAHHTPDISDHISPKHWATSRPCRPQIKHKTQETETSGQLYPSQWFLGCSRAKQLPLSAGSWCLMPVWGSLFLFFCLTTTAIFVLYKCCGNLAIYWLQGGFFFP